MNERDLLLYNAKLSMETHRYDDMRQYVKSIVLLNKALTTEEKFVDDCLQDVSQYSSFVLFQDCTFGSTTTGSK